MLNTKQLTPEYLDLMKIKNLNAGNCEKYVAKADSIACDAVMNYEFRQDDLTDAIKGAIDHLSQSKTHQSDIDSAVNLLKRAL